MTATALCQNCQSTISDPHTGNCANCGSGMLRIPVAQPIASHLDGPDIVILQDSVHQLPVASEVRRPPSSTSHAETLILPPDESRDGSTAIRLGVPPTAIPAALPSGVSSTNKFTLVEELGRGGMGIILRGRDKVLHRDVALKVIRDPGDQVQRERFIKEAQVTGQLEHPNIVPVHEFGVDQSGRIFFAMKLVRGRTLGEVLDGHRTSDATLMRDFPLSRMVTILIQVCHAVAFAHSRGVIHRDLKPSNIMLGDFGEVMLMDWGLAKVGAVEVPEPANVGDDTPRKGERPHIQRLDETQDGSVLGTPVYMPPEQALGQIDKLDARSDVYALGAILYELLALRTPVEGVDIKDVLHKVSLGDIAAPEVIAPKRDIPRDLSAVAMKALSLKPEHRYGEVADMRRDLERFLDGRMVSAREDNLLEVLTRFVRRHRIASLLVGSATVLLIGVVTVGYLVNDTERRRAETERHRAEALQRAAEENQTRAIASGAAAEQERQRATTAQHQAEEQRQLADRARQRADAALESESRLRQRSEQTAHLAALSLANEQIARRDYDAARAALDACPTRLRDWPWRRLALLCHRHLAQFDDHVRPVRQVCVGDSGRLMASIGDDGTLVVNDLVGHQRVVELALIANTVALAADTVLLAAATDSQVLLINARTGQITQQIAIPGATCLAIRTDGQQVALGDSEGGVWWCDPVTGLTRPAPRLAAPITAVSLSADGGLLIGDRTGAVLACDPQGNLRWQRPLGGTVMALSTQGLALVRADDGKTIRVQDATSGTVLAATAQPGVIAGCFSTDGERFALSGEDRTARVYASADGTQVVNLEGHVGAVLSATFFAGHSRLLSAGADGTVRVWDATHPIDVRQLAAPGRPTVALCDATGQRGVIARDDGTVHTLPLMEEKKDWAVASGISIRTGTISASTMVLGGDHGQIRLLDLRTGEAVGAHGLGTNPLIDLVSDAAASRLFALDGDGWLRGIDRVSGTRFAVQVLVAGSGALALVDQGRQVVCGGADGALVWCAASDGAVHHRDATPLHAITTMAASDDGGILALAGDDQLVLWNSATRQVFATLRGHAGAVNDLSFNRDGTRLISAGSDGTVRIWDAASGRALLVIEAHAHGVTAARLIGDDRELVTVGTDGSVRGWLALDRRSWD